MICSDALPQGLFSNSKLQCWISGSFMVLKISGTTCIRLLKVLVINNSELFFILVIELVCASGELLATSWGTKFLADSSFFAAMVAVALPEGDQV